MQKRIRQIAAGKFESDQPSLSISDEELFLTVTEGQEYTGEFEITSENHIPVRGIVYSTHPRMECLTPQFEGENIRIRYQFHSKGLVEGQEEKGAFVILCNQSVHSLSFVYPYPVYMRRLPQVRFAVFRILRHLQRKAGRKHISSFITRVFPIF